MNRDNKKMKLKEMLISNKTRWGVERKTALSSLLLVLPKGNSHSHCKLALEGCWVSWLCVLFCLMMCRWNIIDRTKVTAHSYTCRSYFGCRVSGALPKMLATLMLIRNPRDKQIHHESLSVLVLGFEHMALHMLTKYSNTELHLQATH